MAQPVAVAPAPVRFGTFELDPRSGELRKNGARVKLEGQPVQILAMLVARPGELVTREELKQQLWPADTFVDFEHSLNAAVKRLRDALDDSATTPRFIETLPRRGYRFIYPLNGAAIAAAPPAPAAWWHSRRAVAIVLVSALLAALTTGMAVWRTRTARPGEIVVSSVAVLPLKNLTGDKEQEYVADGMTDVLTTELAQVRSLLVPSVTSAMLYKTGEKRLPQIARELKVEALVEGSVQRPGDRILLNVQLVHGATDRHLWAKSYEADPRNLPALLREVARDIIRESRVQVAPQETQRLAALRAVPPEAYEAFLRARFHLSGGTAHGRQRAEEYFQLALDKFPDYADAHAGLARVYAHGGAFLAGGDLLTRTRTREHARKALALDPDNPEAYTALAFVAMADWDWQGAEQNFRRALELNPNHVTAHTHYSQFLAAMGRFDEALAHSDRARQLAPFQPIALAHASVAYLQSGRTEETLARAREFLDLDPASWYGYHVLARVYLQQGKYQEAIAALQRSILLREAKPGGGAVGPNANHGLLAYAYAKAGQRDEALKLIRRLEEIDRNPPGAASGGLAIAYVGLGDHQRALQCIETGGSIYGAGFYALRSEPLLEPLRPHPRFQAVMRRMGLALDGQAVGKSSTPVSSK